MSGGGLAPADTLPSPTEISMDNIIDFLIHAKKATYAGNGAHVSSCRPNSKDLRYQEGNYTYYDTYLGGNHFIGEEAVWENGIPCWAMNYSGRLLDDSFSFDFLKEALLLVTVDKPYRGPALYQKDGFTYKCTVNGDFSWFYGYEEIYFHNQRIYECRFHGGIVK